MAKVTITITDQDEGIKVLVESDPPMPEQTKDETNAQALAMDIVESIMANATDVEEHSLN